jgi:hypothetical protein
MINNLDSIKDLMVFESEDDFYHLQILKRKKENPDIGSNSYVVKTYYIRSFEYLDSKMDEIINLCNYHNARACINLNRRSFEKMAFHMLKKVTDQIMNKDYKSIHKAYESVCGAFANEKNKKWIVDVDYKDFEQFDDETREVKFNSLTTLIQKLIYETGKDDTIHFINTKNGFHLICSPFNMEKFRNENVIYPEVQIHKDNPTILYVP